MNPAPQIRNKTTHAFNVTVTAIEENSEETHDAIQAFWQTLRRRRSHLHAFEYSNVGFEIQFERNFGLKLKECLIEYFTACWQGETPKNRAQRAGEKNIKLGDFEKERRALAGVFFRAKITDYGSLDFSVEISGLNKICELFDNNFDLFTMVLGSYVPLAFERSFEDYEANHGFRFEYDFPLVLSEAFSRPASLKPTPATFSTPIAADEKLRWVWATANGSLVVPVLLALSICYVTFKNTAEERKDLAATQRALLTQYEMQVKSFHEHMTATERLQDAIIKRFFDQLPPSSAKQLGH